MSAFDSAVKKISDLVGVSAAGLSQASASLPVVPTSQQFLSTVKKIAGDDTSHNVANAVVRFPVQYDTYIVEASPTFGYAGAAFLSIGYSGGIRRGLIRFDLTLIAGLTLSAASLHLYNTDNAATTGNGTVEAYRVTSANTGWDEGGLHVGSAATLLEPSWNKKTQTPSVDWAGSAGLSTVNTDYTSTLAGSAAWTDGAAGWLNLTLVTGQVQTMANNNAGFLLKATDETASGKVVIIHSKENTVGNEYDPYLDATVSGLLDNSSSVFAMADGAGATWANGPVATTGDAPIPTSGIELPLYTIDTAQMSFFVPTGVNVWYAILGPK